MDIAGFERLFGLDIQLLFDVVIEFLLLMFLYFAMSRLFFRSVRRFLEERQEVIQKELGAAQKEEKKILELKAVYEDKLDQAKEEAGELLARSRQAALDEQEQIIARAKQEATLRMAEAEAQARQAKEHIRARIQMQARELAASILIQIGDDGKKEDAAPEEQDPDWTKGRIKDMEGGHGDIHH